MSTSGDFSVKVTAVSCTLRDEKVYWNLYDSPANAHRSLATYQECYNRIRPHWALRPVGGGDPLVPDRLLQAAVNHVLIRACLKSV